MINAAKHMDDKDPDVRYIDSHTIDIKNIKGDGDWIRISFFQKESLTEHPADAMVQVNPAAIDKEKYFEHLKSATVQKLMVLSKQVDVNELSKDEKSWIIAHENKK